MRAWFFGGLTTLALTICGATVHANSNATIPTPPDPLREFRAVWVATVYNIDWPSRPGLPAPQQQAELLRILDTAAALNFNAIILQVRPACDAFYASPYEPWSAFLTGRMGSPPQPFYDPLEFAVREAHQRGLQLHAWFNPVRARSSSRSYVSAAHVSRTRPEWVRTHGNLLWLDPGLADVRQYSIDVIMDVVRRYDIDGVHIDDYFYPYPVRGKRIAFNDAASWSTYKSGGGRLSRDDWRRENINLLVRGLHESIKYEKDWVLFGVSPFGIWRPGIPEGTTAGIDAVKDLHADSLHWFKEGWLDYFAPQLYWNINSPGQSYPKLLRWWQSQNVLQRHLWPGIASDRIGQDRNAREIIDQINLNREQAHNGKGSGSILWSFRSIGDNKGNIAKSLGAGPFNEPALVPATPWLGSGQPAKPVVTANPQDAGLILNWSAGAGQNNSPPRRWLLQTQRQGVWTTNVLHGDHRHLLFTKEVGVPDWIALRAIDAYGNLGPATMLRKEIIPAGITSLSPPAAPPSCRGTSESSGVAPEIHASFLMSSPIHD